MDVPNVNTQIVKIENVKWKTQKQLYSGHQLFKSI